MPNFKNIKIGACVQPGPKRRTLNPILNQSARLLTMPVDDGHMIGTEPGDIVCEHSDCDPGLRITGEAARCGGADPHPRGSPTHGG